MSVTSDRGMELLLQIQKYLFVSLEAGLAGKNKADSVFQSHAGLSGSSNSDYVWE